MIALVLAAPPWDPARAKAGLDLAMTLATFELPFDLCFVGAGCYCLNPEFPISRQFASLPLYGCDSWLVDQDGPWIDARRSSNPRPCVPEYGNANR